MEVSLILRYYRLTYLLTEFPNFTRKDELERNCLYLGSPT
jgi:hypothetical protein